MQYGLLTLGLIFLSSCAVGVRSKRAAALNDNGILVRNKTCSVFIRKEVILAQARRIRNKESNAVFRPELDKQIRQCEQDTTRQVVVDVDEQWLNRSSYSYLHHLLLSLEVDVALLKKGNVKLVDNISGATIGKYYYKKYKHGGYLGYNFLLKNGAVFYDRVVRLE